MSKQTKAEKTPKQIREEADVRRLQHVDARPNPPGECPVCGEFTWYGHNHGEVKS